MGSDMLRKEILITIKSLQPSLMQLKHGQKVIQKLQKTYPAIFNGKDNQSGKKYKNFETSSFGSSSGKMSKNSQPFIPKSSSA